MLSKYSVVELPASTSSVLNKSSQPTEKLSRTKFSRSNLHQSCSEILDLLPEILQKHTKNYCKLRLIIGNDQKLVILVGS